MKRKIEPMCSLLLDSKPNLTFPLLYFKNMGPPCRDIEYVGGNFLFGWSILFPYEFHLISHDFGEGGVLVKEGVM